MLVVFSGVWQCRECLPGCNPRLAAPVVRPSTCRMPLDQVRTAAVVTTYRRSQQLARLLQSIEAHACDAVNGVVVVDNAGEPETERVARQFSRLLDYLPQKENRGHGAGHAAGMTRALADPAVTHVLLLDDDAVLGPGTVQGLVEQLQSASGMAVPLLEDSAGALRWFPGPLDRRRWKAVRATDATVKRFVAECGTKPVRFTWAPWPILLVERCVVEAVGVPRSDFGFMADDIEYALRITARYPGWLVPTAVGLHCPPVAKQGPEAHFLQLLELQNLTYVALRLAHGRGIWRHMPGHYYRFLRAQGWRLGAWGLALAAGWRGALRGPAGRPGNDYFRQRWREAMGR